MKNKKSIKKSDNSKIIILIAVVAIIILFVYMQKSNEKAPEETSTETTPTQPTPQEPIVEEPIAEETVKEEPIVEEPEPVTEPNEPIEEPEEKEECTLGFKCLDKDRVGYQSSNCMFSQVVKCDYGCKDGECIKEAPDEEESEEKYAMTKGTLIMNKTGWRYSDFDEGEFFQIDINDYDFKLKLYSPAVGRDYLRAESSGSSIWAIDKGVEEATRSDCVERSINANAYVNLKTSQTLCVETREKDIALVGGNWDGSPKEDTEITWRYYS